MLFPHKSTAHYCLLYINNHFIPDMPEREDAAEDGRVPAERPEKDHGFLPEILPEGEATDVAAPEETIAVEEAPIVDETAIEAPVVEETAAAEAEAEIAA